MRKEITIQIHTKKIKWAKGKSIIKEQSRDN